MILKYFCILMCFNSAFGSLYMSKEKPKFSFSNEQNLNITMNINDTVNPCDDFYAYACGNYSENHPDDSYQEITSFMDYQYNNQLLNLMNTSTLYQQDYQLPERKQTFVEKTKIYFKSCLTTKQRDIKKYLEEFKPADQLNWPIWQPQQWQINGEANKDFDVWSLLGRMHSYGLNNVLIDHDILAKENGTFSIVLDPASIENNTTLPDMMMMRVLLRNLGIKKKEKILENLLQLNEDLLRILKSSEDSNEIITPTHEQLHTIYPQLNLRQYFRELFGKDLPATTLIVIRKVKYFQYLNDKMWQTFRKRTMCNYLMLKFLVYVVKDSVSEFTALACIKDLRNKMDVSVNYLYKTHIFANDIDEISKDIVILQQNILQQFNRIFNENHLKLNAYQLQLLRNKLQGVTLNIGNLPLNATNTVIENYYDNVPPLDESNYFKNHLHLLRHRVEKSLLYRLDQTHYIVIDNNMGSISAARYVPRQNMIILPFGSLQKPLYNPNYHPLYKFSLIAFILAHEYAHAFDTFGLIFNGYGEQSEDIAEILKNPNFQNSLECLKTQLTTNNIDECLADIVGSQVAHNLFKTHSETPIFSCPPDALSSTQYTCDTASSEHGYGQKQFYLSMAQFFCGKSQLQFVDHDSDSERINQIAMNSKEFAKAFHCPLGTKMNPDIKCRIY